jgi:hypothetical protein
MAALSQEQTTKTQRNGKTFFLRHRFKQLTFRRPVSQEE